MENGVVSVKNSKFKKLLQIQTTDPSGGNLSLWQSASLLSPAHSSHQTAEIGNYVRVPLTSKGSYGRVYIELHGHLLICKKNLTLTAINFIDLPSVHCECFDHTAADGKEMFIMLLSKGGKYDNLIFESRHTRSKWISKLFKYCTFGQFDMFYKRGMEIGRGAFGKVAVCERRGQEKRLYAVKENTKSKITTTVALVGWRDVESSAERNLHAAHAAR